MGRENYGEAEPGPPTRGHVVAECFGGMAVPGTWGMYRRRRAGRGCAQGHILTRGGIHVHKGRGAELYRLASWHDATGRCILKHMRKGAHGGFFMLADVGSLENVAS
jgi:hypothetical protein